MPAASCRAIPIIVPEHFVAGARPLVHLASNSPRRRELLTQIGVAWELVAVEVDERRAAAEEPEQYVRRLASLKARAGRLQIGQHDARVLAADTAVVFGDEVFGKPDSRADAQRMLRALSARTHVVLSAVALVSAGGEVVAVSRSEVSFRALTDGEIDCYWNTGEPRDKAGAYAIQGLAAAFVRGLHGSYSGVMGLPLFETATLLRQSGLSLFGETVTVA